MVSSRKVPIVSVLMLTLVTFREATVERNGVEELRQVDAPGWGVYKRINIFIVPGVEAALFGQYINASTIQ